MAFAMHSAKTLIRLCGCENALSPTMVLFTCFLNIRLIVPLPDQEYMECDFQQIYDNKITTKYHAIGLASRQLPEEEDTRIELFYGNATMVSIILINKHDNKCYSSLDQLCLPWIDSILEINQNFSKSTGNSTDCPCLRHTYWTNGTK